MRNTSVFSMRSLTFLQELHARHGDVFKLRLLGGEAVTMVASPELAREVLLAPADVLCAGEGNRRVLADVVGPHALMLLEAERHMRDRRLMLPSLHGSHLARHAELMRAAAAAEIDRWPPGGTVPALPRMLTLTLEIVMRAVLGVTDEERLRRLRRALRDVRLPVDVRAAAAPEFRRTVERVEALLATEIAARRDDPGLSRRDDVLSLLLEARYDDGAAMTDDEVRDELMALLVAGSETTAGALAWTLERLARAPDALERAAAEADDGGGPYTDAAIQETLRMRPVVPMVARVAKRPFDLGGRTIDAGATVVVSSLLIHHRPDVYDDPFAFRPERFLERPPGTYTWMPFGGGVRRCIGSSFALLEMRVVLSTLLARARPRAPDPAPEEARHRAMTMVPARGARLALEPRAPAGARRAVGAVR